MLSPMLNKLDRIMTTVHDIEVAMACGVEPAKAGVTYVIGVPMQDIGDGVGLGSSNRNGVLHYIGAILPHKPLHPISVSVMNIN
uniref:HrcA domain-containing protein n=1 Tax=Panagrellus redivivus TaxID=6233 RepID=A0A7E4V0D5_PANRE